MRHLLRAVKAHPYGALRFFTRETFFYFARNRNFEIGLHFFIEIFFCLPPVQKSQEGSCCSMNPRHGLSFLGENLVYRRPDLLPISLFLMLPRVENTRSLGLLWYQAGNWPAGGPVTLASASRARVVRLIWFVRPRTDEAQGNSRILWSELLRLT